MQFNILYRTQHNIMKTQTITAEDFFQAIDKFNITHNPEEDKILTCKPIKNKKFWSDIQRLYI